MPLYAFTSTQNDELSSTRLLVSYPTSRRSNSVKLSQPNRKVSPGSVRSLTSIFEEKEKEKEKDLDQPQSIAQRGRVMSYHQTYRTVSNPINTYNPSPASMHRKPANYPASLRSVSPLPPSIHSQATSNSNNNNLHSPTPSTPLNSFPPRAPISPSITPPIQPSIAQQPQHPHNLYPSPASTTPSSSIPPAASPFSILKPLSQQETDDALRVCLSLQTQAVTDHNKRPFAALLLGPDNTTVIASHNSISHYQHAESELARLTAIQYSQQYLERCTLVSTWEPCAMCSGTIYWTGIGRVLYAASEGKLKELTGSDNKDNMTMNLSCRTVFDAGQRRVEVVGPVASWEGRVVEEAGRWWREHNANMNGNVGGSGSDYGRSNGLRNFSGADNGSIHSKRTSITVYNPDDSMLGSIGEDGEYQADLKVDWMS